MQIASIDGLPPSPAPAREGVAVSGGRAAAAPAAVTGLETAGPAPAVTASALHEAITKANQAMRTLTQAVEFQYDAEAHETVVRVVDTTDHQVLRQVPTPEMIEIARALERMQSILIRAKA